MRKLICVALLLALAGCWPGPGMQVTKGRNLMGGAAIQIMNTGTVPLTIKSVDINNGSCKAVIPSGHMERNPNYHPYPITFVRQSNPHYEKYGQWCAADPYQTPHSHDFTT